MRYFIVPLEEHLFTKPASERQRLTWFENAFLVNRIHRPFESKEYAIRITEEDGNFKCGKLSKKTLHHIHEITTDDIEDVMTEDWPYLEFMCDLSPGAQTLVIEYNSSVIYRVATLKFILEAIANGAMFQHGYAVKFDPILDDKTFWKIIDDSPGVFSVTFSLNSPNLFGAESSANEALASIRDMFNNTKTEVTLSNEKGLLKVPKEAVDKYREYVDKGGGEWTLRTRTKSKRKRKYVSTERALKAGAEKKPNTTILSRLRAVYELFTRHL